MSEMTVEEATQNLIQCIHRYGSAIDLALDKDGRNSIQSLIAAVRAEEAQTREALVEALKALAVGMDRAGGDRDGMPECPWCKDGPHGFDHRGDCELVAARAALNRAGSQP